MKLKRLKLVVILVTLSSFFLLNRLFNSLYPIYAKEATTSSSPPPESSDIKLKIEELKSQIASKAAKLKQEINKKIQNKALVGEIISVDDPKLTLQTKLKTYTVITNEYTVLSNSSSNKFKKALTLKTLSEGNNLVVLGDVDDNNSLNAKKIIVINKPESIERQINLGKVEEITAKSIKIATSGGTLKAAITSETQLLEGSKEIAFSDMEEGKSVIISSIFKDKERIAKLIFLKPNQPSLKTKPKETTPSSKTSTSSGKNKKI
ncbi:MAG: hypothetical protein US86_C0008G0008 [Candidatus Daviesbacteria bacterium GW2011_GWA2_38_24]|uniref:Uncharacterized protein n=1 Tax=Candidatus Daviesbacteria bacterium GW2011_GWA2_38_24 TaxID=1618422 RepID=A0A0G0JRP9_9BACT|nr:MAG: hypothetical protein US86_C0008G0008 [Candidatus Daviesbacteria bacterium GW2011_GWA2_38_24]KKQ78325.1 MAG: hypothetical protein UT01_C0073G0004 [Candidatus Daviesbacteria bacterium GW2011_GWA1_38_7]OGE24156.1 MAG: hypothetical protein A2688_00930 [Candidatus Daviesbacteria bacterium RIFCSPHIGHO2_01_FULL_38_8]